MRIHSFCATQELSTSSAVLLSGIFQQSAVRHVTREGERGSLWAFPRKPFVGTPVIIRRGREKEEEEEERLWGCRSIFNSTCLSVGEVRPPRVN